jgi:RHS repeat-associated protein
MAAGYGGDSAESGPVYDEQSAVMEAVGYGAGTVSFYWKVSSEEDCDYLEFYIDDELQDSVSGEVDWVQKQYNVSGSGAHVFRWQYVKDYSDADGEDRAWVDYLQWTGAGEPPEQSGDWETVTYVYDPAGRRIAKAIDGDVAVRYLYDGDHVIAEYDGDDVLLRKFIYGPGVDQPICMIEAGGSYAGAYYYHFDGLGSVVALSDADGETVQTYEYSVYGEPAASDPNHPNPYLFTARRFDPETGLYHYRARAYNPYIGRFLQTDPAGQGMNAYTYCANSPVGRVDPSGLAHYNVLYYVDPDRPQDPKWWLLTGEWNIAGIHHQFGIHSGSYKIFSRTFFPSDGAGNSITVYYAKSHSSAGFASTSYKSGTGVPIDGLTGITRYLGMMQDLIADACDWNATDPSFVLAQNWMSMAPWDMFKYLAGGAGQGAADGWNMAIYHDQTLIDKYGGVGAFSSKCGWVSEGALVAAGGIAAFELAGSTMSVAVGTNQFGGVHFAYGAGGTWLHAASFGGTMTVTEQAAASFAGTCSYWTTINGIPVLSTQAVLSTVGNNTVNCATAVVEAVMAGWGTGLYTGGM